MNNDYKNLWIAHGTNRPNADVNLLLFTYAGGSPSLFAPWKRFFDDSINLCPILYPGRELRKDEPLHSTVKEMAQDFVDHNLGLFKKDFALFGHCTGILVAYEVATYVRERLNREPLCLIASGTESPRYSMTQTIIVGNDDGYISDSELVDKMVEYELVSPSFKDNKNFIQYYIPTYRNDLTMLSKYEYDEGTAKLSCPIFVMKGNKDKTLRDFAIKDWDSFTTNRVSYHEFEGGHFYLTDIKETMTKELTAYIRESKTLKDDV